MKNLPTSNSSATTSLASKTNTESYVTRLLARMDAVDTLSMEQIVNAECPSVITSVQTFGKNFVIVHLEAMITHMAVVTGLLGNITKLQTTALANTLIDMAPDVTMVEMKQFFKHFEQGRYERFYGKDHPNMQTVTASFRQYLSDLREERNIHHSHREAEAQRRMMAEARANAVPCPPEVQAHLAEFGKNFGQLSPEQTRQNIREFHERMRKAHRGGLFGVDFEPQLRIPTPEQQAEIDRKKELIKSFKAIYEQRKE